MSFCKDCFKGNDFPPPVEIVLIAGRRQTRRHIFGLVKLIAMSIQSGLMWQPTGKIEKIGGVDSYVATPEADYPKDKVVLYLSDVFGLKLENNLVSSSILRFRVIANNSTAPLR